MAEPATLLNLDFDLWSTIDLTPLAIQLDLAASLLYRGHHAGEFHITVEPVVGGLPNADAVTCTRELLGTLASLPVALRELFDGCHRRVFDYGLDGGLEAAPCSMDLPAIELSRIAQTGIDLRVAVDPCRA
jgi:hypothetical protein